MLGDDNKNYENNDNDNDIKYNDYEILYEFASPIFFDFFSRHFQLAFEYGARMLKIFLLELGCQTN